MQIYRMDLAPQVATLHMYPIVVEVARPFINARDDMNAGTTVILWDFMSPQDFLMPRRWFGGQRHKLPYIEEGHESKSIIVP